jgi:small subunit ribosomal protein S6
MAFYEAVFITRQDIPSSEVDNIISDLKNVIQGVGGKLLKDEYWGTRALEYEIKNNKKGHYVLLGIEVDNKGLQEVQRRMKLREGIIRSHTIRQDQINLNSSAILKKGSGDSSSAEEVVNVTALK